MAECVTWTLDVTGNLNNINLNVYKFLTSAKASAKSLERSMTGRSRAATIRTLIFAGIFFLRTLQSYMYLQMSNDELIKLNTFTLQKT